MSAPVALDRATRTFTVTALGTPVAIDLAPGVPAAVAATLQEQWQPAQTAATPTDRVWCSADPSEPLPAGATALARSADPAELAGLLCDAVLGLALQHWVPPAGGDGRLPVTPPVIGVRAGAVVRHGRAVLLAGRARLDAELQALAGWAEHLADRAVAVRMDDGRVLGAPTPVCTVSGGSVRARRVTSPAALGLRTVVGPAPLGAIVLLERTADTPGWETVGVPVTVARLAPLVPVTPALPQPVQDLARLVGLTGGALVVRYHDPAELIDLLDDALAAHSPQGLVIPAEPVPGDLVTPTLGAVRRARMVDGISDGDTMAVCRPDGTVVALAGLGPLLWDAARDWVPAGELLDRVVGLVEAPGQEDEVRLAAATALDDLVGQQILSRLE